MIYFDTDVLVHYFVEQDQQSSKKALEYYHKATETGSVFCSLLALMETAYVLSRLQVPPADIEQMIQSLHTGQNVPFELRHFLRAMELGKLVGFRNISDCIYTAVAETYCDELVTFHKSDFKRIQKHTRLKITILS